MRWIVGLAVLVACGGGGGSDPREGGFEVLAEGTGDANSDTLFPLRSGTVSAFRGGTVRPPIEFAPGRVGYRYYNQANQVSRTAAVDAPSENWLTENEDGVWFEGSTKGGVLDVPILLVPSTVRVGMRWRTSSRTYEVLSRDERETPLGPTTLWTIVQETTPPIYRLYAEGWGLVELGEGEAPDPYAWEPYVPIRSVSGTPEEEEQDAGPTLALRELPYDRGMPELSNTIRAVRLPDSRTLLNICGTSTGLTGSRISCIDLLYDGALAPLTSTSDIAHFPESVFATRVSPWFPDSDYEFVGSDSGINALGIGNVVLLGSRVAWTPEEMFIFENELGGVSGGINAVDADANFRYELALVPPGYGTAFTTRPHWGGFPQRGRRVLLAGDATPERVPLAHVVGELGELWSATSTSFSDGRWLSAPVFVEAFPDAFPGGRADFRSPAISTTTAPGEQVHLFTTPGGIVDRIVADAAGVRRERLGRVELPQGHELMSAADVGDDRVLVITLERDAEMSHLWLTDAAERAPVQPAPFVSLSWSQWDARVCWPATSNALDASDWKLGGQLAAAVVTDGDNCAVVVRDLEAMPIRSGEFPGQRSLVFEGTIPAVGYLRAFEPYESTEAMRLPSDGGWLADGGAVSQGMQYSSAGIPLGRMPHTELAPSGVPDQSGAGLWVFTTLQTWAADCDACTPDSVFAIELSGTSHRWEVGTFTAPPMRPVQSGGLLVQNNVGVLRDSDHAGDVHLRPDGSLVEVSVPAELDQPRIHVVRSSGEVCGSARGVVWCAGADGSDLRSERVEEVSITNMHLLDDDTALVWAASNTLLIDLDRMSVRLFPDAGTIAETLEIGADGVTYGVFIPEGGVATRGAFYLTGFVPLSEIYDATALWTDSREVSGVLVARDFAYVSYGMGASGIDTLRIPRSRWDGTSACTPTTTPELDADGDGFVAASSCGTDCDDGDAEVNPDTDEVCDGVDNDCNGLVDEVGGTCWGDADEDGFALADAVPMTACRCPAGTTSRDPAERADCADEDARANPEQTGFFDDAIIGTRVSGTAPYDFDCNGTEEGRWPIATCTLTGPMMCTGTDGFTGFAPCGVPTTYQGCPDPERPTMCSGSCTYDIAGFCGGERSTLLWTQECR